MNYSKFCPHGALLHELKKREIEQPFSLLDNLCKKRTAKVFKHELDILLSIILKSTSWKNHDPGILYQTCIDLIRMVDVLYLVHKYSPSLSTLPDGAFEKRPSTVVNDLALILRSGRRKADKNEKTIKQSVLDHFFSSCHPGLLKMDIKCCLQIALDASYMTNDKYEYFGLNQSTIIFDISSLYELIDETYLIHSRGEEAFPKLELCPELAYAKDKSHPTHLFAESISEPLELFLDFYDYYLDVDHMHKGIKSWKKLLYSQDFWKQEESPGNLIYLHDRITTLIDACWLADKKGQLKNTLSKYPDLDKHSKRVIKKCNKEEAHSPVQVIRSFFAYKALYEWKEVLDEWLLYGLSNAIYYTDEHKKETSRSFKYLLKLLEAAYLITR